MIIDCGSHDGSKAVDLVKVYHKATIYCFKPIPKVFQQLVNHTKAYPSIHCFQLALSEQDGIAEMYVSSLGSNGSSSLLKPSSHLDDHPEVIFDKTIVLEVMTLDTWGRMTNVQAVDLL